MNMNLSMVKERHDKTRNTLEQPMFRAIVVGITSLTLSVMLGSLAFVTGRDTSGFQWGWSWWGLVWFAGGLFVALSFCRAVLRLQVERSDKNKAKLVYRGFGLFLLGVGAFLFPLRFFEQQYYFSAGRGLFTAFVFLGSVVVMLFKIGQGLFAKELADGQSS
jgi:hypothetical protein